VSVFNIYNASCCNASLIVFAIVIAAGNHEGDISAT
jgi:hypothetical protein